MTLALVVSISSCKDFFEEDISSESMVIITPSNNAISTNLNITFDWDDLQGAYDYRFLIGSPNLSSPSSFYLDSTCDVSVLELTLNPGNYEWKLKAQNSSSATPYSQMMNLTIDSSYSLTGQSILSFVPLDNYFTNSSSFAFNWQDLYSAEQYNLLLKKGANWNTGLIILDTTLTSTNLVNPMVLAEDNYTWGVKALNNLPSETDFSTPKSIKIDLTVPNSVNLNLPSDMTQGLNADSSYLFDWSRAANSGTVQSSLFDSIYIYNDTIQEALFRYGSLQEDTSLTLPSSSGIYYWNVITFDEAGNQSSLQIFKKFTVN